MPYNSRVAGRNRGPRTAYQAGPSRNRNGGGGGRSRGPKKDYIHPSRFVKVAKPVEEEVYTPTNTFGDFDIHPVLKANIAQKGYEKPSPIQDEAIPLALQGRDIIGLANTGTGKTVAFALPVLHRLMTERGSKVLIIAPTRELAQQIQEEFRWISRGTGMYDALLIGGAGMGLQLKQLRSRPEIIIGTPGRIKDHIQRGSLKLNDVNTVVLDEVDRMLDMGFVEDVSDILGQVANDRQSLFFSATMDKKVEALIEFFSNDPVTVSVKTGDTTDNVHQDVVCYDSMENKIAQLHNVLIAGGMTKAIVFDDTQRAVERLSNELLARGFKADAIHGGKSQGQRRRALDRFKRGEVNVLVATDVAARGIDVVDISHVINYSTPQDFETYSHRVGRTGRAGKIGHALTFITG